MTPGGSSAEDDVAGRFQERIGTLVVGMFGTAGGELERIVKITAFLSLADRRHTECGSGDVFIRASLPK